MHEHAIANAKAWLADIVEMVAQLQVAEDKDRDDLRDEARERIEQSPLSIQVRDGWRHPGERNDATAEEFEILLSTGGPALRIYGELGAHGDPQAPDLQWQDWGTPWTRLPLNSAEYDVVRAFAAVFWFGD